jgi:ribA/ribD-fused uncharacterized protein
MTIERFRNEHFYLSSMFPLKEGVEGPGGVVVPTVEHAYQAEKFLDPALQRKIMEAPDGFEAKRIANKLEKQGNEKRPDWEERKIEVMRGYVRQKFERDPDLTAQLLETNDETIVEGNPRNDTFWGVSPVGSNNGQNHLGIILMETRAELASSVDATADADRQSSDI